MAGIRENQENVDEGAKTAGRMDSAGDLRPIEHTELHATPQPPDVDATGEAISWWEHYKSLVNTESILNEVIRTAHDLGIVGADQQVALIYLTITSRFLERPASLAIKGPSSAGKSFPLQQVLKLFPPEAYVSKTAGSERSLIYSDQSLKHRTLILNEEAGLGGSIALYLVRSLLSEGYIRYETVEKTDGGGFKPKVFEREGPTGLIVTTTQETIHPEVDTRLLSITIADTPEQTRAIFRALANKRSQAIDLNPWLQLQRWLSTAEHRVEIPFAPVLADLIPPIAVRLRRDFGMLLNLIRAHAILHQATRERDENGNIIATLADYTAVRDLTANLLADGVDATVSETIRETVEVVRSNANNGSMTVTEVAKALGLDKSSASRRVKAAIEKGYLVNYEQGSGPARLRLGEPLPDTQEILPNLEALIEGCRVAAETRDKPSTPTDAQSQGPEAK